MENIPWGVDLHNYGTESAYSTRAFLTITQIRVNIFKYLVHGLLCAILVCKHYALTILYSVQMLQIKSNPKGKYDNIYVSMRYILKYTFFTMSIINCTVLYRLNNDYATIKYVQWNMNGLSIDNSYAYMQLYVILMS